MGTDDLIITKPAFLEMHGFDSIGHTAVINHTSRQIQILNMYELIFN